MVEVADRPAVRIVAVTAGCVGGYMVGVFTGGDIPVMA